MDVRRGLRSVRNAAVGVREGLRWPPGHFLSPVPGAADTRRALAWARLDDAPGVDLHETEQLRLLDELGPALAELPTDLRYHEGPDNVMFEAADAAVYSAMLRRLRPSRVLEVGSGFSTAVALDAAERWDLGFRLTCVEPYPDRLLSLLRPGDHDRVELRREPVQDVPPEVFAALGPSDVLFVDSSHVAKAGSDVVWLVNRVLPSLAPGVHVHFHDVHWPFEYLEPWLQERWGWSEDYLLHAFLSCNAAFRVELFLDLLWGRHRAAVERHVPGGLSDRPGGLWLLRER